MVTGSARECRTSSFVRDNSGLENQIARRAASLPVLPRPGYSNCPPDSEPVTAATASVGRKGLWSSLQWPGIWAIAAVDIVAGHQYPASPGIGSCDPPDQRVTIHAGHLHVRQHRFKILLRTKLHRLQRVLCCSDVVAGTDKDRTQQGPDGGFIIDD